MTDDAEMDHRTDGIGMIAAADRGIINSSEQATTMSAIKYVALSPKTQ
jgi:hypothetical protein